MNINTQLTDKLNTLKKWFENRKGSIVAFSGGIDSALVLYLARQFQGKERAIGVISNSESLKSRDFEEAKAFCAQFDIQLEVIKTKELEDERYSSNPIDRCFYCKEHLFNDLSAMKAKYQGFDVLSGTNFDDLGDYRPGINAAQKYEVLSPMVECKVTKSELRQIALHYNLPNWNKPSSPCLSSRIPYSQSVTDKKLRQIEAAENLLNEYGFIDVRVRHYGDLAKIEVRNNELAKLNSIKDEIISKIVALGFARCEIDNEGLVSGKLNRIIKNS